MKTAVLNAPRDFRVVDVRDPKLTPDGAIIRVKAFGICGSELPPFERGLPDQAVAKRGIEALSMSMFGHEWSGEVVEVGANVTNVKSGDRVAAGGYGGYSEYMHVPTAKGCIPLPDDMSYEVGATIEPAGIGVGLAAVTEPQAGDTAVVLGAGMIGQGASQAFKTMGVSKVIVTDLVNNRLAAAKALGADMVINTAEEDPVEKVYGATSELGADIVAICCTDPAAFKQAFEIVRGGGIYQHQFRDWGDKPNQAAAAGIGMMSRGGKVVMVAAPGKIDWEPKVVYIRALTVMGSIGGRMGEAFELMRAGKINTEPLITHEFPLASINEAFEMQLTRDESVKVLVKP